MSAAISVIAGVVAFLASASLARPLGRMLKRIGTWALVAAGVVILIAATALAYWGLLTGDNLWWGIALGLGFGGLNGLRYGRGTLFDLLGRRPGSADGGRK
jgi:hypothetical protein